MASNIRHANSDDETNCASKESRNRVANNRGGGVVRPLALPDYCAPGYHWQTSQDEHDYPNVGEFRPEVAREEDDDEAEAAEGELEYYRLEAIPAKSVDDEGPEAAHGTIYGISKGH